MDNTIEYIKVEDIIPSKLKPHKQDNTIDGLTISIQNYGVIQPLLLRRKAEKYEIVLGNRRYNAALKAGLKQVPAIIAKLNDKETVEYIILDNIQRKPLTKEEEHTLYNYLRENYKTDKYYVSSNLGLKQEEYTDKQSNSQSNIINEEEFKLTQEITNYKSNKKIESLGKDIVSLEDLNQKELEREDFIMNNEQINTNVNNMNEVKPMASDNNMPTFGGRFFPSLEDEQTNMGLNNNISAPTPSPQPSSPLIDLTDLTNEPQPSNPQLEPTPSFANPTVDTLNQTPQPEISIKNVGEPVNQASSQIPPVTVETPLPTQENISEPTPSFANPTVDTLNQTPQSDISTQNVGESVNQAPSPVTSVAVETTLPTSNNNTESTPNLTDLSQDTSTEISSQSVNTPVIDIPSAPLTSEIPSPVVPTLDNIPSQVDSTQPQPINIITDNNEVSPINYDNINPTAQAPTLENQNIETPLQEVTSTPDIPQLEQVTEMPETPKIEKNDIEPAINTIKSLVDSMASIGYNLKITENDLGATYNISIDIQK